MATTPMRGYSPAGTALSPSCEGTMVSVQPAGSGELPTDMVVADYDLGRAQVAVAAVATAGEAIAVGTWAGTGVLGPEVFPAHPFLDLLGDYGSPWGMREQ